MSTAVRPGRRTKTIAFFGSLALYLAVGYWLQVEHGFIIGDALSRVSAAETVLYSRQPHVAAIGFIFTPLTALVQLPVILLSPVFPALTEYSYAGTLMSAPFMAAAAVQIMSMGFDRSLPRGYIVAITALFALNPMIIFYGANGMSEAPFLFFVVWAVRRLVMWMADDDIHHLVAAGGIALAMSYLTRYDAVACIALAGFLVAITTYLRAPGPPRLRRAFLRLLLVSGPGFASFIGWAVASWLITGEAFAQFTSQYGNTAILQQSGGGSTAGTSANVGFALACTAFLAPTLIPITLAAVGLRWRRPLGAVLVVPVSMYGAILAFQAYSYISGTTFGFLRFYIVAIPFAASMAMLAVPEGALVPWKRRGRFAPTVSAPPTHAMRGAYTVTVIALAVSIPTTLWAMASPHYAPQEYALRAVLNPAPYDPSDLKEDEHRVASTFSTERKIAHYLDGLNLPDGSIIADTVYGFAVVAASERPTTFVIPSDTDFVKILNDPATYGVKYLLAVPMQGRGTSDALNLRYPTLYETGADVATLDLEFHNDGDNQPIWRLYRVNDPEPHSPDG